MNVSVDELQELKKMLVLANLSYYISGSQIYTPKHNETCAFYNMSNIITFVPSLLPKSQTILLMSKDLKNMYISFAGTHDTYDEISDLDFLQVRPKLNPLEEIRFHNGFYKQFLALKDSIKNIVESFKLDGGINIYLIGHSSGGCVASITAYYLTYVLKIPNINVTTFGSPFFTNKYGSTWFNSSINYTRVEINRDPVPKVPEFDLMAERYFHVSKRHIFIKKNKIHLNGVKKPFTWRNIFKICENNKPDIYFHRLETYKTKLENIILD
jgi:hypothetical protein